MKLLIYLALLGLPITLLAEGGLPNQPYIYVEGKAEIEKLADIVTLKFNLVARNADQAKANQEAQAKAGKIFTTLNEGKIAEKDVVAADLKSEPQYEGGDEGDSPRKRGKLVGYSVTRTFSVKVRDVTAFPQLVNQLLAITGVEFSGIDEELSNEKDLRDQVWEKAVGDAHERAEKTVKVAGMKIDSVFALSPVSFSQIKERIFSNNGYGTQAYAEEVTPRPNPLQYRLSSITVEQSVHAIYLISPAKN